MDQGVQINRIVVRRPCRGNTNDGVWATNETMHIDVFDYELPEHLIAQQPCAERDQSRLLVVRRGTRQLAHHSFRDLSSLLRPGDLLVLNDTLVLPARLLGRRERTGGKWEGLFLHERSDGTWEMIGQTRGRLLDNEKIVVDGSSTSLFLTLVGRTPDGQWLVRPSEPGSAAELLGRCGQVPLPPYIRNGRARDVDRERYQTVYARKSGAVAAPTGGLHFTPRIFDDLRERGIGW